MKRPIVDTIRCTACAACTDLCPTVFKRDGDGRIVVSTLAAYPHKEIDEVIKRCLGNCIAWQEGWS